MVATYCFSTQRRGSDIVDGSENHNCGNVQHAIDQPRRNLSPFCYGIVIVFIRERRLQNLFELITYLG